MAKKVRVAVRFPVDLLRRIDRYSKDEVLDESSRSRAIRILVEKGLEQVDERSAR